MGMTCMCVLLKQPLSCRAQYNLSRYGTPYFYHRGVTAVHMMPPINCSFPKEFKECYFLQGPTNAQLIEKLSHSSYVLRHYCVILREFVSTLPSYTSMSNAAVGNIL